MHLSNVVRRRPCSVTCGNFSPLSKHRNMTLPCNSSSQEPNDAFSHGIPSSHSDDMNGTTADDMDPEMKNSSLQLHDSTHQQQQQHHDNISSTTTTTTTKESNPPPEKPTKTLYQLARLPPHVPTPFKSLPFQKCPHTHDTITKYTVVPPKESDSPHDAIPLGPGTKLRYKNFAISQDDQVLDQNTLQERSIGLCPAKPSSKHFSLVEVCLLTMQEGEEAIFRIDVTDQNVTPMVTKKDGKVQETPIHVVYQWVRIESIQLRKRFAPRTFDEALQYAALDLERARDVYMEGLKQFPQYTGEKKLSTFDRAYQIYKSIVSNLETCPANDIEDEKLRLQKADLFDEYHLKASKNAVSAAIMKWRVAKKMNQYLRENQITNRCGVKESLGAAKDMAIRLTTSRGHHHVGFILLARICRFQGKIREAKEAIENARARMALERQTVTPKVQKEYEEEESLIEAALKKETNSFMSGVGRGKRKQLSKLFQESETKTDDAAAEVSNSGKVNED